MTFPYLCNLILQGVSMHWYVLYTNPRSEKKVANRLSDKGFEVYCPLREEIRLWSDRRKKVKVPVFTSYVFIRLESYPQERTLVLETPGVARFLWWLGKPAIIRDQEIEDIHTFLEECRDADINMLYQKGDEVKIDKGPFKEYQGIIIDLDKRKAVLNITSLGLTLRAQLPLAMLKKLSH